MTAALVTALDAAAATVNPSSNDATTVRIGIAGLGTVGEDLAREIGRQASGAAGTPERVVLEITGCDAGNRPGETCASALLARLRAGALDLALVPEDRFAEAIAGMDRDESPRAVQRILYLYLHVLVRRSLHVESLRDLPQLEACVDPDPDAGATIARLLDHAGVSSRRLGAGSVRGCPPPEVRDAGGLGHELASRRLDVALLLAPAGDPDLAALIAPPEKPPPEKPAPEKPPPGERVSVPLPRPGIARLDSLDYRTVQLLEEEQSEQRTLWFATLPRDLYGAEGEAQTVAVPVLLVARDGRDSEAWQVAADRVVEAWKAVVASWEEIPGTRRRSLSPPPGHPLSTSELPRVEWGRDIGGPDYRGWLYTALLLTVLAGSLVWLLRSRRPALRRLRESRPMLIGLVVAPSAVVVVTLLTYLFEHRYNEHFSSPAASFWSITVYLFSGLEDRSPFTTAGKVISAFGLILGPVMFTLATGWVASRFIHWERKMPKHLKDHYLLLNWNARAMQAVRQIHHPVITAREGVGVIVVLSDDDGLKGKLEGAGMGRESLFEDLYVSYGDPTKERSLLNANAQDARTILVLADERRGDHADERTLCSLVILRKIARDLGRSDLHVVAELVSAENQGVCDELARDFPGLLETVSSGEIRSCLLAQATLNRGLVAFFKDLLTVSEETNELYTLPIPEAAVGRRFGDFAAEVLRRDGGAPMIPVGLQRSGAGNGSAMMCNPRPDGPGAVIEAGDRLVVLAYEPPEEGALSGAC